jgi:hypothetical protein
VDGLVVSSGMVFGDVVCYAAKWCEYGDKGRLVKYWARLGCWISPCYGPFSLGVRFETYELFISLIFKFFSGRGKPRLLIKRMRGHTYIY